MKVLIVEDEVPARKKLVKHLRAVEPDVSIAGETGSVRQTVEWLESNPAPDLAFFDIRLSDGSSFRIFEEYAVETPVIFITAYDEYLLNAFRTTGIEYLLKPLKADELEKALQKYHRLKSHFKPNLQELMDRLAGNKNAQRRVVARKSGALVPISVEEIAYFTIRHGISFLVTHDGDRYVIDEALRELEDRLNPEQFYRINRQYLVNADAIRKVNPYSKSRLRLDLRPETSETAIVSQEKASEFKAWLRR